MISLSSRRDLAAMETKHLRDWSSAAKARWHREIQSCRICVSEIVEAERGLVTVDSCRLVAPVTRPEHPEDQVRAVRLRESRRAGKFPDVRESNCQRGRGRFSCCSRIRARLPASQ